MWFLLLIISFAIGIYLILTHYKYWEKRSVPYLKPYPLVGNLGSFVLRRKAFCHLMQDIYESLPNLRYLGYFQFLTPVLMIRDPELIKQITISEFNAFPDHNDFVKEDVDPLWGKNLASLKGKRWHKMRATLSPAFTSNKMKLMFNAIKSCARQFTNSYQNQVGIVQVEMKDAISRFTNDVIGTTQFGVVCNSFKYKDNEFYVMGRKATTFTGIRALCFSLSCFSHKLVKLLGLSIFPKSVRIFFSDIIRETLAVRAEKSIVRPDMIQLLLEAREGSIKDDFTENVNDSGFAVARESGRLVHIRREAMQISDEDITAQALLFFAAGFETSSTFMSNMIYELAVNPDVQQKLFEEITLVGNECRGEFTYEDILGMKYLDKIVCETLRKWPPITQTDRHTVAPFTIPPKLPGEKSLTIDKGTFVMIPIIAIHRDPLFYPDPDKFDPERFSDENKKTIKPCTYLPFGSGPRNCIGSRFALIEGKLIVVEILWKFEIVKIEKTPPFLQISKNSLFPTIEKGLWLGLKSRSQN